LISFRATRRGAALSSIFFKKRWICARAKTKSFAFRERRAVDGWGEMCLFARARVEVEGRDDGRVD
jgi:hypothetical protein